MVVDRKVSVSGEELLEEKVNDIMHDEIEIKRDDLSDELDIVLEKNKEIQLSSGKSLTLTQTYDITAKEETTLVVLVGPSESGKSTIETTLYQLFQRGEVSDYYFAGSKTIQGYEQRSFYTRLASNRSMPSTPRTPRSGEGFLHLKLWNYKKNKYHNFLFADLSGENLVSSIGDTKSMIKEYEFVKHADFIVAVIDGASISNKKKRNGSLEKIGLLLRTIGDAGLVNERANMQVIFSKHDIVDGRKLDDLMIDPFIERVKKKLNGILEGYGKEISYFDVAAMPENSDKFSVGHGVDDLLVSWCEKIDINDLIRIDINNRELGDEFNRLYGKLKGGYDEPQ